MKDEIKGKEMTIQDGQKRNDSLIKDKNELEESFHAQIELFKKENDEKIQAMIIENQDAISNLEKSKSDEITKITLQS